MSQDENSLPRIENPKEEAKTPQTTTGNKKHTNDTGNSIQETPKNSQESIKTAAQPPTPNDTIPKAAPTSIRTTETQKTP